MLEANPHFLGPAPAIARIEFVAFESSEAILKAVNDGEIDYTIANSLTMDDARALQDTKPELVFIRPSNALVMLAPDLSDTVLAQREVRQLISHGIDRRELGQKVYGDSNFVEPAYAPTRSPSDVVVAQYDKGPDHNARFKLAALGAHAEAFPLHYVPQVAGVELSVRETLQALGLQIALQPHSSQELIKLRAEAKGYDGFLLTALAVDSPTEAPGRWWNLPRDADYDMTARHDAFDERAAVELQRLLLAQEPVRQEQSKAILMDLWAERLPLIPLLFAPERIALDPKLRGWDRHPSQYLGRELENWYFVD